MKTIRQQEAIDQIPKGSVVTIGNFDGVHLGHQQIIAAGKKIASARKTQLVVMSFYPHPAVVLNPTREIGVLTPLQYKGHLLSQLGVDCLFVFDTTAELLSLSPLQFVDRFLSGCVKPVAVVEGPDFNFGAGRAGSLDRLQQLGAEKGFEVCVVPQKQMTLAGGATVKVSSTTVRNLLQAGAVADAARALTRPYRLLGTVVPGKGKGRKIGFPTANLQPQPQIIPQDGVYAGWVLLGDSLEDLFHADRKFAAVFSIGTTPTVEPCDGRLIEAHIIGRQMAALAGKYMAMDFVEKLRGQKKFPGEKDLARQIESDCETATTILKA